MQTRFIVAAVLLSVFADAPVNLVYAQADQQTKVEKKAKKGSANRECRRVKETGSRIAKRICKKPEQWAREEELARENIEQTREGANRNTSVAGQQ